MNYAIILAGGKGVRCIVDSTTPKQLLPLGDSTVITQTLNQFQACNAVDIMLVVANNDYLSQISEVLAQAHLTKLADVVPGGISYYDSMRNGIKYFENNFSVKNDDIITIHGASCPFVSESIIKDSIKVAKNFGAAAASPDTTASVFCVNGEGFAYDSIDRTKVRNSQFPYSYRHEVISTALGKLAGSDIKNPGNHPVFLNDCKIALSKGSWMNIKITTEQDYKMAKIIFAGLETLNDDYY